MITGGFTFRNKKVFKLCYNKLILNKGKVNGEYYADSLLNEAINLKLKCKVFLIDSYISWGTPNELKTYQYWQSCFHKWDRHPYDINLDKNIPSVKIKYLEKIFDEDNFKV